MLLLAFANGFRLQAIVVGRPLTRSPSVSRLKLSRSRIDSYVSFTRIVLGIRVFKIGQTTRMVLACLFVRTVAHCDYTRRALVRRQALPAELMVAARSFTWNLC